MSPTRIAAAAAAVLAALAPAPSRAQTNCVSPPIGRICGTTDSAVVAGQKKVIPAYKGIRYAVAPTGANNLRWRAPVAVSAWSGTVNATSFGSVCLQKAPPPGQTMNEDCLFLNVWTPKTSPSPLLPVMVFIHGGAFVEGAGSSELYDGAYLAASGNAVVVTLNYRLGALGFLYAVANDSAVGGNLGLLDQQTALAWVRRNIGAFGGDSARVTVFGESAGAMSTGFHLFAMPASDSLFQGAIMESNPLGYPYRTAAQAAADGADFLRNLCLAALLRCEAGRGKNDWLQNVDSTSIRLAGEVFLTGLWGRIKRSGLSEGLPWAPMIDGVNVKGQPYAAYIPGMRAKPFIFGVNRDEGVIFASLISSLLGGLVFTPAAYDTLLVSGFGVNNAATIKGYTLSDGTRPYSVNRHAPNAPLDSTGAALAQVLTDFAFNCANLAMADSAYKLNGTNPIFGYRFAQLPFFNLYKGNDACLADGTHVCHAYELPYVFNTFAYADTVNGGKAPIKASDLVVMAAMTSAWTNFASTRSEPSAVWAPYVPVTPPTATAPQMLVFQPLPAMQGGLAGSANCSMWKSMPPFAPPQ